MKDDETIVIIFKWLGLAIALMFMVNSESFRSSQGDEIVKLKTQIKQQGNQIEILRMQVNQLKYK